MKIGWKLVARLGMSGSGYPHLLVDRHGWCLRLGPNPRVDDKYYSRLLFLMEGLVEQALRRDVFTIPAAAGIDELRATLRESLRSAIELGTQLECILQEAPIRMPGAPGNGGAWKSISGNWRPKVPAHPLRSGPAPFQRVIWADRLLADR